MSRFLDLFKTKELSPFAPGPKSNPFVEPEMPKIKKKAITIEDIHATFYTEVDRILADCRIIKESKLDEDEVARMDKLSKLGFSQSANYQEFTHRRQISNRLANEANDKRKITRAVEYFAIKYPLYKFITTESIVKICKLYGLIYGDSTHFVGEIPEKNLDQLLNYSIHDEDLVYLLTEESSMHRVHGWRARPEKTNYQRAERHLKGESRYGEGNVTVNRSNLQIAADKKLFNTRNMNIEGVKLIEAVVPQDPVVFHPVMFESTEYFLIITAWGEEASDPAVVNQVMN